MSCVSCTGYMYANNVVVTSRPECPNSKICLHDTHTNIQEKKKKKKKKGLSWNQTQRMRRGRLRVVVFPCAILENTLNLEERKT